MHWYISIATVSEANDFYVVVYNGPMVSNLGRGFALRCFQRLSRPNIATRHFTWWQSR